MIISYSALPSISTADSIDWKEPAPEEIKKRILDKTRSGSILLFHNDLANTTEALPQILTELKARGFEFVTVSELVYKDNYTVDANGEQSQIVQSGLDLSVISEMSDDEIRAVIAQNADKFAAAGFTEQQALEAAAALKNGNIPDEVQAVISQFADALPVSAENTDADKDGDTDSENDAQTSEPEKNSPDEESDSGNIAQTSEPEKGAPDVEGNR